MHKEVHREQDVEYLSGEPGMAADWAGKVPALASGETIEGWNPKPKIYR